MTDSSFLTTLLDLPFRLGPLLCLALLFATACTLWLLVTRIQANRHLRPTSLLRDLSLLFTGPVIAILASLSQAYYAGQVYLWGPERFSGAPPEFYLSGAETLANAAILLLVIGLVACSIPSKLDDKAEQGS